MSYQSNHVQAVRAVHVIDLYKRILTSVAYSNKAYLQS
jgi:hypothetical protein